MALRIRRGTNSQRAGVTFEAGEIAYTTDTKKLYVGDGATMGGVNILATSAGVGLAWNNTTQSLDVLPSGTGLTDVVQDTSPQLGANLDLNSYNITGTGNINITGSIASTSFAGNILASDNSTLLNNTTKTLSINNISLNSGFGSVTGPLLSIQTSNTNWIKQDLTPTWLTFFQSYGTSSLSNNLTFVRSRGTTVAPTTVQTSDQIINIATSAFTGTSFVGAGSITCEVTGTVTATATPVTWYITASDSTGTINPTLAISSEGTVTNRYIQLGSYTTTQVNAIPTPNPGMMVFNSTTQKYQGYVSDTGLASGGPSNGTPGWVDFN